MVDCERDECEMVDWWDKLSLSIQHLYQKPIRRGVGVASPLGPKKCLLDDGRMRWWDDPAFSLSTIFSFHHFQLFSLSPSMSV